MASGPITSWQIDGETMETVTDFIFLGSKITVDGDCSREIKFCVPFPEFQRAGSDSCQSWKGWNAEIREEQSECNSCSLGSKALVPALGIHKTIILSCFQIEKPLQVGEASCPEAHRPRQLEPEAEDDHSHWPHHLPIRRMSTSWSDPVPWTL